MNIVCFDHGFKNSENDCNLRFISGLFAQGRSALLELVLGEAAAKPPPPPKQRLHGDRPGQGHSDGEGCAQKKSFQN